jgi:hypothetical protein
MPKRSRFGGALSGAGAAGGAFGPAVVVCPVDTVTV